MLQNCNTFLDVKEHISCVLIDQIVVTLKIGTLTRCVTRRRSNTFMGNLYAAHSQRVVLYGAHRES